MKRKDMVKRFILKMAATFCFMGLAATVMASSLSTVAGGGDQGVDMPAVGAEAKSFYTDSYAVQQGMTRHFYFPSYEVAINPIDGSKINGIIRVDPYGNVDWLASDIPPSVDDIAVDYDGSVLVVATSEARVYRVNPNGTRTVVAGTGATGNTGDGGPATEALLGGPEGLAVDEHGNVYIGTMDLCLVRKVTRTTGIISTVAGSLTLGCGYNGDRGIATQTQLATIRKIAIDKAGNLLIPDGGNNVVWKVDLGRNTIARIAGRPGVSGYTGDGGSALNATFASSRGVDTDPWGNIYVVDRGNNVIRKIDRSGIITTVAGTGTAGYSDNPTDARQGMLNSPTDVSVDLDGQLYIADYFNRVIRRVAFNPAIESISPTTGPVGTKVVIKGKYFGTYWGASSVKLGALTIPAADVTHWSNTELHVKIPAAARPGISAAFTVTAEGGLSNASPRFTVR